MVRATSSGNRKGIYFLLVAGRWTPPIPQFVERKLKLGLNCSDPCFYPALILRPASLDRPSMRVMTVDALSLVRRRTARCARELVGDSVARFIDLTYASGLIHSDDSQIDRSSSSSRHESRNYRERH